MRVCRITGQHCCQQHNRRTRQWLVKRLDQERGSHCQPESSEECDCKIQRGIRRHRLYRLTGRVDHRNIGAVNSGGQARLFHLLPHSHIEFIAGVRFLPHYRVFSSGLVLLQAFAGCIIQALADHLLTIGGRLPGALDSFHKSGIFRLFLPVKILKLTPNLHHAREVRAVFGAELSALLFQVAASRADPLQGPCRKATVVALQSWIGGNDKLWIAHRGSAIFSLTQNPVSGGRHQLPAQFIDLKSGRVVYCLACRSVAKRHRSTHNAVIAFEGVEALLVLVHACLQFVELDIEPV